MAKGNAEHTAVEVQERMQENKDKMKENKEALEVSFSP